MDFDSPTQYEVAAGPQHDEEGTEDDEVDVEVCVLDVQLAQHVIRFTEHTLTDIVMLAVQWFTIEAVDRLQHPFERIPTQ